MNEIAIRVQRGNSIGWASMPLMSSDFELPMEDFVERYVIPALKQARKQMEEN